MKRLFAVLALVCMASSTFAADLTKAARAAAPAQPACTTAYCVGFYGGLDISGNGTNVNILNGLGGSLNANGTEIGGHAGFRSWNGTVYLGVELGCAYDISMNIVGTSIDRLRCMELAKAGGALSALFGQQSTFQVPAYLQNSFVSFYGIVGASEKYGSTGIAAGVGAEFLVAPKVSLTLDYINVNYSGGGASQVGGLVTIPTENLFRMGVNYDF